MSDDRRKLYSKKGTGTVPKIKYAKNTIHIQEHDRNIVSNNLGGDLNSLRHLRNPERYPPAHYYTVMEQTLDEANQNSISLSSIGSLNDVNSRRNSTDTVPKCDNITKYPDKKQIEDKLNQIREYLHITSSLMSNMKNNEEQSSGHVEKEELEKTYNDLKDSEAKLVAMLADIESYEKTVAEEEQNAKVAENCLDNFADACARLPKNVLEKRVEQANHQLEMIKEQENLLLSLQQKAEQQLRAARQAQHKLSVQNTNLNEYFDESLSEMNAHDGNETVPNKKENHDSRQIEERLSSLRLESSNLNRVQQLQNHVDLCQQRVTQLRDSNDNRNQLIQLLDKRDVQLQNEHAELQGKLCELQQKKRQVDHLVSQLQNMNDESEEDDMGAQVRKIVCMKEQLSKLKDMLEIVKSSEDAFESLNVNESDGEMAAAAASAAAEIVPKTDNLAHNDVRANHENAPAARGRSSNERRPREKQVNKKTMNAQDREKLKLQAELQAKKRELEELMCKHKAASSNLNQDVHCENKSDHASANNAFDRIASYPWYPMPTNIYHQSNTTDQYSSDDCPDDDINEYSEINSSGEASNAQMIHPVPPTKFDASMSEYMKYKPHGAYGLYEDANRARTSSRTPTDAVQQAANAAGLPVRSNDERVAENKNLEAQKHLELIKGICDTMLEQHSLNKPAAAAARRRRRTRRCDAAAQNVRNDLTPSPLYSEPRRYASSPNPMNAVNVVGGQVSDGVVAGGSALPGAAPIGVGQSSFVLNDAASGYQNWLATNTLQTQAFMLNTLNQCCQMLWLQQREIAALRNSVVMLQEKLQIPYDQNNPMNPIYSNPCVYAPPSSCPDSREGSQMRAANPSKVGQVSSAASMPNLNHPPHANTNIDYAAATTQNNLHNARILEQHGLNNAMHHHNQPGGAGGVAHHANNATLLPPPPPPPGVNQQELRVPQLWNGQALNNQVAPGNRANNYWDNFRSYSRQNLLSTKSNEGLQNHPVPTECRLNNATAAERTFSYPFAAAPLTQKRNSTLDSANSSVESTPRRSRLTYRTSCPLPSENPTPLQPDVLNVDGLGAKDPPNPLNASPDVARRNEWQNGADVVASSPPTPPPPPPPPTTSQQQQNSQVRSKAFDGLRENIYKEVASLISANQGRPHFLIQLFRDLQLISSDPLRRQTLRSIQSLISDSLISSSQKVAIDGDVLGGSAAYFDAPVWNQNRCDVVNTIDNEYGMYLTEVLIFLNVHGDELLQSNLIESLKDLTESALSLMQKNGAVQKHFAGLLSCAFEQYKGKRVQDVRIEILQTIEELLRDVCLTRFMRESVSESSETAKGDEPPIQCVTFDLQPDVRPLPVDNPQMQNGDLAEADQSRLVVEEDDDDEEGAVGGVLGIANDTAVNLNMQQMTQDEFEMPKIDFAMNAESDVEFSEQGLDQVPTRLTTRSRSKVNSSRDLSNSSRSDTEQF